MLIALAPFQGQAQSTDDMEGQHAYPPLLHELGIPLLNRARVIDIESVFTSERGGRLVIATQKPHRTFAVFLRKHCLRPIGP